MRDLVGYEGAGGLQRPLVSGGAGLLCQLYPIITLVDFDSFTLI